TVERDISILISPRHGRDLPLRRAVNSTLPNDNGPACSLPGGGDTHKALPKERGAEGCPLHPCQRLEEPSD
ncbi:MAG TPA: hypothetical protein VKP30_09220, partial [Polyangiaceae bacterium]|nr:hypothetical protein [Polyangiaceae bacterium]